MCGTPRAQAANVEGWATPFVPQNVPHAERGSKAGNSRPFFVGEFLPNKQVLSCRCYDPYFLASSHYC